MAPLQLHQFLFYSYPLYVLTVGVEGCCFAASHTWTHKQSVGLPWTRDVPVAETSTRTTQNIHERQRPCLPDWIRTRNPSKRTAADLRLRPRGYLF